MQGDMIPNNHNNQIAQNQSMNNFHNGPAISSIPSGGASMGVVYSNSGLPPQRNLTHLLSQSLPNFPQANKQFIPVSSAPPVSNQSQRTALPVSTGQTVSMESSRFMATVPSRIINSQHIQQQGMVNHQQGVIDQGHSLIMSDGLTAGMGNVSVSSAGTSQMSSSQYDSMIQPNMINQQRINYGQQQQQRPLQQPHPQLIAGNSQQLSSQSIISQGQIAISQASSNMTPMPQQQSIQQQQKSVQQQQTVPFSQQFNEQNQQQALQAPQQPNMRSGANAEVINSNSTGAQPSEASNVDKRKLIQQQLRLLLHAYVCKRQEQESTNCPPHCRTMRAVISHMTTCHLGKNCQTPHCASSRQIISHYKTCTNQFCPVCQPLKSNRNADRPGTSSLTQQPQQQQNTLKQTIMQPQVQQAPTQHSQVESSQPQQQIARQVEYSIPIVNGNQVSSHQMNTHNLPNQQSFQINLQAANPHLNSMLQDTPLPINGISQPDTNGTDQGWRSQVKGGHRQHLVRRIVQTIFPSRDPTAYKDPRMSSLIDYAKKVEKEMFQLARGIDEYFQMLAEKCHKIHKELSEKRRSRQAPAAIDVGGQGPASSINAGHPNNLVTSPVNRNNMSGGLQSTANISSMDMSVSVSNCQARVDLSVQSSTQEADSENIRKFGLALRSEYNRHQQSVEETVPTTECLPTTSSNITATSTNVKTEQGPSFLSTTPDNTLSAAVTSAETGNEEIKYEPRSYSPIAAKSVSSIDAGSTDNTPKDTPTNVIIKDEMKEEIATTPGSCSSVQTPAGTPLSTDKSIKIEVQSKNVKKWTREELLRYFLPLHKILKEEKESGIFLHPVDPDELHIPDYYKVITHPMDLSTINKKLEDGEYSDPWAVVDDYWLMFNNAWLYNKKTSKVYKMCSKLAEFFDSQIDPVMQSLGYCCGHDLFYLPQLLYCSSPQLCLIGKESVYYQYDNTNKEESGLVCDKYLLCDKCFTDPGDDAAVTDDPAQPAVRLNKDQFVKKKNNVKEREAFVHCRECGRKWHQVCALHLPEIWSDGFICKTCVKDKSIKRKENRFIAKKLPGCKLSAYLEKRVNDFLKKKDVSTGEVTIRVLSSCDKVVEVKPGMRARFSETGEMAESFPYRLKAIFAYQDIDGQDVCFFGLHVQEYGSECQQPNNRRVYVSYLDSVYFFRPKEYRTDVYHEILVGYLHYVKYLGYTMAHIWACPPGEGDDYIFHMHPYEQRIPKPKRLQEWYQKMLEKALSEGIVVDYRDILRDAYETKMVSPAEIPYFEGDFWPNTFEEIFRELDAEVEKRKQEEAQAMIGEEEDVCDTQVVVGDKRAPDKKKPKKRKGNGRSGISTKRKKCNNPLEGGDDLSRKVYETMDKNKDMFFVIRLHKQIDASNLQKIEDPDPLISCDLMDGRDTFLQLARDRHLEFSSLRRAKFSTMVMVYELHTENRRDFMYTCNVCNKNIDTRYHCNKCEEYDLCPKCYLTEKHPHPMLKIAIGLYDDESSSDNNEATIQESRRSSLERFVKVLGHSSQCRDVNCRFQHCCKMKQWTSHFKVCKKRAAKQCPMCQRFLCLLFYHAKCCQDSKCVVPLCRSVKENMRQQQIRLRLQQTQMLRRRMQTMQERSTVPQAITPVQKPVISSSLLTNNSGMSQQSLQQCPPINPVQTGMSLPGNNLQRPCYPSQGAIEAANQAQQMAQMQRFSPAQHQQPPPHVNPQVQQQHPMPQQPMSQQSADPQGWRLAPGQQVMIQQRDSLTIEKVITSIRSQTPDHAEQQKKIREWFANHKEYIPVYRMMLQRQQQQQQQHQMRHMAATANGPLPPQQPQQAPPPQAVQQQPQLRGMLMNGQQQTSSQPHHQWMLQQQQQRFRGPPLQQSVPTGSVLQPPAYSTGQQPRSGMIMPMRQPLPSAGMTFSQPPLQTPGGMMPSSMQQSQMYSIPPNQDPSSLVDPSVRTDLMPPHFVDSH